MGSPSICAESRAGPEGECSGLMSWFDAAAFCEADGARLCTDQELLNDEALGTGCGYDSHRIWSSTFEYDEECAVCFKVARGATYAHDIVDDDRRLLREETNNNKNNIKQQSPNDKGGSDEAVQATHAADKVNVLSVSTCADLGWINAAEHGDTSVCSESDTGLGCSGLITWPEAALFCESVGARLCTSTEIQNKNTFRSGCSLENRFVWSSTECDGGFSIVKGKGSSPSCASTTTENYARCCADTSLGGSGQEVDTTPSPVKTHSVTRYEEAHNPPRALAVGGFCECIDFAEWPGEIPSPSFLCSAAPRPS